MEFTFESMTEAELINRPFGPDHVVATVSPLFTVDASMTVHVKTTVVSVKNRSVFATTDILGEGTRRNKLDIK